MTVPDAPHAFVAYSEIAVPADGAEALVDAYADRLREVEAWPGFGHLDVWQDVGDPSRFVMVSWWDRKASFTDYMHSDSHRRSHARIAQGPGRPRPVAFTRFRIVAR